MGRIEGPGAVDFFGFPELVHGWDGLKIIYMLIPSWV